MFLFFFTTANKLAVDKDKCRSKIKGNKDGKVKKEERRATIIKLKKHFKRVVM